ncbi:very short patch repair endonuclease [Paracoccus sp. SY]|uniref:very short patch repair endonuclease n=1 Tax=Paracoccus sp. SY TaxID=1330255 RepID=UPI001EFDA634|nr:very short patch repair endonuclease [Paracoccus sp. SY]
MAAIRSKNTKPELIIRRGLHALGYRYRLHDTKLLGKPDLVLPKHRAVIFVHGCFWHGHDCHLFHWPANREDFWRRKIEGNMERDRQHKTALGAVGWRIATVWECSLKGRQRLPLPHLIDLLHIWLSGDAAELDLRGRD